jgi:hypothetical protein
MTFLRTVVFVPVLYLLIVLTAHAEGVRAPFPVLPDYLVPTVDPESGLTFTRISKPGVLGHGLKCGAAYCRHRYSSSQAWNADQSLLLLSKGCGGYCFLDGQTYQPLFFRPQSQDCEWLPNQAEQMICGGDNGLTLWSPRTDTAETLFSSNEYKDFRLGPGKGNPSLDGQRIVVRAENSHGATVAFIYDLVSRSKLPDVDLSRLPGANNYCSISPLGQKVVCIQTLTSGVQQVHIFDESGMLLQSWLENHRPGHGDMTIGDDGTEYMVGISKSTPDKYRVIKRRLDNGDVTTLTNYGEATHVSMRAIRNTNWAFVSFEGDPAEVARHPKWAPFGRQIVALALDGSSEVRLVADTRNIKVDYVSEAHGSPSPDGSQIIWASNWGIPGGPVYAFVTQMPSLAE